ncbi:MAG: hypothetical protein WBC93_01990 [Sulfitobacter sp.]
MTVLDDLHQVTQLRYQQQQLVFGRFLAEEASLRAELARLDNMLRDAAVKDHQDMRSIGADVIWHSWAGRAKAEVNLQLARVLARKEHHIRQVRIAFGKMTVSEEMVADRNNSERRADARRELATAIEQSLAKALRNQ